MKRLLDINPFTGYFVEFIVVGVSGSASRESCVEKPFHVAHDATEVNDRNYVGIVLESFIERIKIHPSNPHSLILKNRNERSSSLVTSILKEYCRA
ncbi:hypothetical protein TNCT_651091 [Trichonephila clavata]|uniref:Uncharacterized protein n=1 Tax=Trichonephila clavata TaxID=2740835 RepID=A0A8X6G747_TRICU|nr:hypothetical protein TNCT_651091 [Trichonephila clavata]